MADVQPRHQRQRPVDSQQRQGRGGGVRGPGQPARRHRPARPGRLPPSPDGRDARQHNARQHRQRRLDQEREGEEPPPAGAAAPPGQERPAVLHEVQHVQLPVQVRLGKQAVVGGEMDDRAGRGHAIAQDVPRDGRRERLGAEGADHRVARP